MRRCASGSITGGSGGLRNFHGRFPAATIIFFILLTAVFPGTGRAQIRITEWMYDGANLEFIELTNVGAATVDMTGWSFDDDSRLAGTVSLSVFGVVKAGESVILAEATAAAFRTAWNLCGNVKVIGANTTNLGRNDEINIYNASNTLVDRLTYGDQTFPGTIRTQNKSGWVNAAGLGTNTPANWTLSLAADAEGSYASAGGDIGSPGKSTRATVAYNPCAPGAMRITEWMYDGVNLEFIEFTNIGATTVDMTGWSYDDDSRLAGTVGLTAFGVVQPGESVILAENTVAAFRTAWGLCSGVKIIGGLTTNLGRNDEINLYNAANALVDRLTYGDQTFPGTIRTQNKSGWVNAAGLGTNTPANWTLSLVADAEGSYASTGGDIGSPGKSTRAIVAYNPCSAVVGAPTIVMNVAATSNFLDGGLAVAPPSPYGVSGVISDPTDPAKNFGIDFTIGDDATPVGSLTVTATSNNAAVVPNGNITFSGGGASRNVKINPAGVGYADISVSVNDGSNTTTYVLQYAASTASVNPSTTRFHTGTSDASTAVMVDTNYMLVGDDENQVLRLYDRHNSGLPLTGFDYTSSLGLTDLSGGVPREVDIEGSVQVGSRIYWLGSQDNGSGGEIRPNRYRLFATDISGSGAGATLSYVGRYDGLRANLLNWDATNAHGLGANYFGFVAGAASGVAPEIADGSGFNIEGLVMAPDNVTAYVCFRAPISPASARTKALIVPVTNFASLVGGNPAAGPATFGAPILLDLGGRGIREIKRNASGQYVIIGGPHNDAGTFRLYTWTGFPADPPLLRNTDLTGLLANGSFESIVDVPDPLLCGSQLQLLTDNGDAVYYTGSTIAKDLPEKNHKKFRSEIVTLPIEPAPSITGNPVNATKCTGELVTFTVSATGSTLTYQWRKNGTDIGGATGDSYTIASIATGDAGDYDAVVSGICALSTTSTPATLTVNTPPTITGNPSGATLNVGQPVTFSVLASGTGLTYQWRKNGSDIGGATGDSYSISAVATGDAGDYDVVVSGACPPPATSLTATLTVDIPLELGDLEVFLGVSNSDDNGRRVDVKAEFFKNNVRIGTDSLMNQQISGNALANCKKLVIPCPLSGVAFSPTDVLKTTIWVRKSNSGNFGTRLWYNAPFSATGKGWTRIHKHTTGGSVSDYYYFRTGFALAPGAGPLGQASTVTATAAWQSYGTWTIGGSNLKTVDEAIASGYSLEQNYPNPFNPSTSIRFRLPEDGQVTLRVLDAFGRTITELYNGFADAGLHEVDFDASTLPSGVYFYRLESEGLVETKRMTLLR